MQDTRWQMTPNKPKALMLAKRQLSELVCDAVNLEGLPFTLPEIQTLIDGVTVGGHKITDQQIALNQAETWRTLFKWIETDQFAITVFQLVKHRSPQYIWLRCKAGRNDSGHQAMSHYYGS